MLLELPFHQMRKMLRAVGYKRIWYRVTQQLCFIISGLYCQSVLDNKGTMGVILFRFLSEQMRQRLRPSKVSLWSYLCRHIISS